MVEEKLRLRKKYIELIPINNERMLQVPLRKLGGLRRESSA
jgi:hypothetical protein